MIKDAIIAVLIGLLVARKITPPGDKASVAVALSLAVMVFIIVVWMEDLWNRYQKQAKSWIHWKKIQLKAWPAERAGRQRRRKMMQEYVRRLQEERRDKEDYKEQEEVMTHADPGSTHDID